MERKEPFFASLLPKSKVASAGGDTSHPKWRATFKHRTERKGHSGTKATHVEVHVHAPDRHTAVKMARPNHLSTLLHITQVHEELPPKLKEILPNQHGRADNKPLIKRKKTLNQIVNRITET